jgi:hypothetical protein
MSENTPRTDEDEIIATIDLVNLAFDSLPEAHIYLALSFCRLLGLGCPKQAFAKIATPRYISLIFLYWV